MARFFRVRSVDMLFFSSFSSPGKPVSNCSVEPSIRSTRAGWLNYTCTHPRRIDGFSKRTNSATRGVGKNQFRVRSE